MAHLQIPIEENDESWRDTCNMRIERLKNTQLSSSDSDSLVEKKFMSLELYQSVQNKNADEFVDLLETIVAERRLCLSDIFGQVTHAGDSLLHVAAHFGADNIAELICNHFAGLLLMKTNIEGNTALHVAARERNTNIIELILSQYAAGKAKSLGEGNAENSLENTDNDLLRLKNEYGNTPLHEAVCIDCNLKAVYLLLRADNSVVHCLNKSSKSPLYIAVQARKRIEVIDLLLEASFVDNSLPSSHGISPLHAAISQRNTALLYFILIKNKEAMYLRDEDGGTPLHYAASTGDLRSVRELLRASTQLALESDTKGHLPIHLACKMGHVRVVDQLLQLEWPNVGDMLTPEGQNILHVAAKSGQNNLVKYLLDKKRLDKSTINKKDRKGNTALHLASMRFYPRTLRLLSKDDRVDLHIKNNDDLTAYDIVWLNSKIPFAIRQVLSHAILLSAGAVRNEIARKFRQPISLKKKWINDGINTTILMAILIATVTFAAGVTVPGSVYNSEKPGSEYGGFSVLAQRVMFKMFMICNTLAMYSSTLASIILLSAQFGDLQMALQLFYAGLQATGFSLAAMSLAFMAAARLVVSNVSWLANIITIIAAIFIFCIVVAYISSILVINNRLFPRDKFMSRYIVLSLFMWMEALFSKRDCEKYSDSQQQEMGEDNDN